jgi:predicted amidohydrolase YtcJ
MQRLFLLAVAAGLISMTMAPEIAIAQQPPDTILIDGRIFTASSDKPQIEALAIRGERITATGTTAEISRLAGPKTRQIDLHGATVIPGINDAHNHLDISPSDIVDVDINSHDPSWQDLSAALAATAKKAPPRGLLMATMGPALFHDPQISRTALDQIAPSNPVMLITFTGHAAFLNTAALKRFAIGETQRDPLGGTYERGADGRLTGVVREYALLNLRRSLSDSVPEPQAIAQLKRQLEQAAAFGITSLQDLSNAASPERAVKLLAQIPAPIRVRVVQMAGSTPAGRVSSDGKPQTANPAPNIRVSGIKWMLDGVPVEGTFTPRLGQPRPEGTAGIEALFRTLPLTFPRAELTAMLKEAGAAHQPLLLHVSGSLSAAAMLQAMQDAGGASQWASRRVRFEHGDGLTADLIPQAKQLSIVVVQNPSHLTQLTQMYGSTFTTMQPLKSLLEAGIPLGLGSDGPVNPYLNILFATTLPNRPSEALSREQAVTAYTAGSAYAEFAELDKGTLQPGKLADLAVLSQDIFNVPPPELPKTKSVLTMVGGKVVYRKPAR